MFSTISLHFIFLIFDSTWKYISCNTVKLTVITNKYSFKLAHSTTIGYLNRNPPPSID